MFKKLAVFLFLAAWSCASFAQTADWATYRTDGHAKSNGVELAIAYPGDWLAQESGGPHIVQQFVSPNRRAYAMILVHDLGPAAGKTRSELSQAISQPEQLKRMVPEGMEVLDARQASIGSVPAAVLEYQGSAQRAGMTVEQRIWTLLFVHGQSMIQLQFAVGGSRRHWYGEADGGVQAALRPDGGLRGPAWRSAGRCRGACRPLIALQGFCRCLLAPQALTRVIDACGADAVAPRTTRPG